jgi:hypothetical protein
MDLLMEFENGRITGEGRDIVGPFVIDGRYEHDECRWQKVYVAAHSVYYAGRKQGKSIAGTWELPGLQGGFKIWPLAHGAGDDESMGETVEVAEPVEAVGVVVDSTTTARWGHSRRRLLTH